MFYFKSLFAKGAVCKNLLPVVFILKQIAAYDQSNIQLPPSVAAAVSKLAQLAVQLEIRTGSSENRENVGVYTASTGALDWGRGPGSGPGLAG